jgi:hypothetical protein
MPAGLQAQDDVYRRSYVPRKPLSDDAVRELMSSPSWQERTQAALEVDLPLNIIAVLVRDEEVTVRTLTYNVHRDIPAELLEDAMSLHPEDAPHIAFQRHVPLAALRVKPFDFASREDVERYLAGTRRGSYRANAFRSLTKSASNALLTLDELMATISGAASR